MNIAQKILLDIRVDLLSRNDFSFLHPSYVGKIFFSKFQVQYAIFKKLKTVHFSECSVHGPDWEILYRKEKENSRVPEIFQKIRYAIFEMGNFYLYFSKKLKTCLCS